MAPSIVPPLTLIGRFLCRHRQIQMQKELRFRLSFDRLYAWRRESEKADVVINIAI